MTPTNRCDEIMRLIDAVLDDATGGGAPVIASTAGDPRRRGGGTSVDER